MVLEAGANVILVTPKGIDDMALKYFVEAGAIARVGQRAKERFEESQAAKRAGLDSI